MRRRHRLLIGGLMSAAFAVGFALLFAGCPDAADDCRNTLTCPFPDAGDGGDGDMDQGFDE